MKLIIFILVFTLTSASGQTDQNDFYDFVTERTEHVESLILDKNAGYIVTCDEINQANSDHNYWIAHKHEKILNSYYHIDNFNMLISWQEHMIRQNISTLYDNCPNPNWDTLTSLDACSGTVQTIINQGEELIYYQMHLEELLRCSS